MKRTDSSPIDQDGMLSRRTMITGSVASGAAVIVQQVAGAQSAPGTPEATSQATPAASPVTSSELDPGRLMMLSANLCGGAILNPDHVDGLIGLLGSDEDVLTPLRELLEIPFFTGETFAATSHEAQSLATQILQYWFLGMFNGEPVENRAEMFFDLASWQALPYQTQQTACKGLFYWAEEIELEAGQQSAGEIV